jgi:TRAP-type uncharacterized transport system fused permease subunit
VLRSVPLEVFPIINIANCSCQRDSRSFSLEESVVGGLFILVPLCLLLWSFVRSFFSVFFGRIFADLVVVMVGANVKAETVTMMDKRKALENEMDAIIARLTRPGGPGLQGNLVDAEVRFLWLLILRFLEESRTEVVAPVCDYIVRV